MHGFLKKLIRKLSRQVRSFLFYQTQDLKEPEVHFFLYTIDIIYECSASLYHWILFLNNPRLFRPSYMVSVANMVKYNVVICTTIVLKYLRRLSRRITCRRWYSGLRIACRWTCLKITPLWRWWIGNWRLNFNKKKKSCCQFMFNFGNKIQLLLY